MELMPTTAGNLAKAAIVFIILSLAALAQASQYANSNGTQPSTISQQPSSLQGSYFDHVLVIMLENEGISDVCGGNPPPCNGANTPYLSSLANSYGISQQYLSLIGTSQPNYVGILGGSIFTCTRTFGTCPAAGTIKSPDLVDRLETAGLTWKGYMESQNVAAGCDTTDQSPYEYTHNGFVEFQDITNNTARCNKIVLANPALSTTCTVSDCTLINDLNSTSAPNFMWLTPNDCDNLHGASVCTNGCASAGNTCMAAGDKYLKTLVTSILNSNTFQKQKSALFITFDEGTGYCPLNNTSEDCLYAVWAGPSAKTSFVSSHLYNMYSLTKTIETNWNLTSLTSNDASATPMTEFLIKTLKPLPPPPGAYFDHLVVVIMEDHGIQEICNVSPPPCSGSTGAPYLAGLANTYAIGSQYLGVSHFSQADYLAMLGGSTENCTGTGCPWPFSAPNLVDRFDASGLTWKGYIEDQSLARGCDTVYHQPYTPEHNPFVGFSDIVNNATRCNNIVVANPSGCTITDCPLINDLNSGSAPNFMWLTPNNCDNMHGFTYPNGTVLCQASVSMGDSYLSSLVPNILNSQAFTAQRSALFVVFDEGNGFCPLNQSTTEDCVYAVWAGTGVKPNFATTTLYNQYSFTKTVEANWNLTALTTNDANASPMKEFFLSNSVTTPPPSGTYFDHVVVIMMENQGMFDICGGNPPPCNGPSSPYLSSLANSYAIGAQYVSLHNQSLPNYLGITGGSTFGCTNTVCPSITAPNIVDRFEAAGVTWKAYMENQTAVRGCVTSAQPSYVPRHNPFVWYQDITNSSSRCYNIVLANPNSCASTDCVLLSDLNSPSAPGFMWLTPNLCNDMHGDTSCTNGCTSADNSTCIVDGDNYLQSLVPSILNSKTFTSQRSALFITFDEGKGYCPFTNTKENCVYAVMAGPLAKTSFVTDNLYNHYSFTKTLEVNWNLTSLTSNDANAVAMTEFFKPPPDFAITGSSLQSVNVGQSATSTVTITSLNGFAGTVSLGDAVPSGLICGAVTPRNVTSSGNATITCSSNLAGNYTLTVTGSNGKLTHVAHVVFRFQDFNITATPPSSTSPGRASNSTIDITSKNQFVGVVALNDKAPNGLTCSITPSSITGSGVAVLSCTASTIGSYTVNVTGTNGSLSHTFSVVFDVAQSDFTLMASPTSSTVDANTNASSTITVASKGGFTGNLTLTLSISPIGLTCSLTPASILLGISGTSTLLCKGPSGAYTVTVTGSNGTLTHSTTVAVNMADFAISASPAKISLFLGGGTSTTSVAISSLNGFKGILSLSASVSPVTGLVCTLSQTSLTGSGTSILSCKPSALGSFNVTVTGVSGSLSHSTILSYTVTVQPSAVIVTDNGSVYNYYQNGTNVLVGRPVGSQLHQVAWKPDGSYALIVGEQGVILTYNGKTLTRFSSPVVGNTNLDAVAWKPDGSYALIAGQNGLIFKFNGTSVVKLTDPTNHNIFSISWNPDGNSALIVGDGGTALLYKTTGQITVLPSGTGQPLFAVAWNPSGTYALAAGGNGVVLRYNGTKFTVLTQGGGPAGHNIRFIAFNQTGSIAILVGDNGQILTYNGSKLVLLTNATNQNLFSVSWSGSTAYIVGQNGVLISYSGGTLKILTSGTNANFLSIAWKPT